MEGLGLFARMRCNIISRRPGSRVPGVPYIILRTCNLDYRCQIENPETYRIDDRSGMN